MTVIDIHRYREIQAVCPVRSCRRVLGLPLDWQTLMRQGMNPLEAQAWDGVLRCKGYPRGHAPEPMALAEVTHTRLEGDGTVIIHLVTEDRRHAACTGQEWEVNMGEIPEGTLIRQCQACLNLVMRGGYADGR